MLFSFRAGHRCMLTVALVSATALPTVASPAVKSGTGNAVPACATPDRLMAYLKLRNPALAGGLDRIATDYQREGQVLGVRWDYAFFQMMVDTASLSFRRPNGSAAVVRPQQNNFAGLGATGIAEPGEKFRDVATGVRAHLQHVLLYAGARISAPVSDRTRKVQAWGILGPWQRQLGRPVTFTDLAAKWSPADPTYGASITAVAQRFYWGFCQTALPAPAVSVPAAVPPAAVTGSTAKPPAGAGRQLAHAAAEQARSEGVSMRSSLGASGLGHSQMEETPRAASTATSSPEPKRETNVAPPSLPTPPPSAPEAEAIRTLVTGRTFVLDASFGTKIPISFRADGTMQGKAGSLSMMLGAAADEGKWWVEKGRLCQRWKVWLEREMQCLRLRKSGELIHWTRDDGKTGTARMAAQ